MNKYITEQVRWMKKTDACAALQEVFVKKYFGRNIASNCILVNNMINTYEILQYQISKVVIIINALFR